MRICNVCGLLEWSPEAIRAIWRGELPKGKLCQATRSDGIGRAECLHIGYEREKARADAAERELTASRIAESNWSHQTDLLFTERDQLRTELAAAEARLKHAGVNTKDYPLLQRIDDLDGLLRNVSAVLRETERERDAAEARLAAIDTAAKKEGP